MGIRKLFRPDPYGKEVESDEVLSRKGSRRRLSEKEVIIICEGVGPREGKKGKNMKGCSWKVFFVYVVPT